MTPKTVTLGAFAACMMLAGCFDIPDLRREGRFSSPFPARPGGTETTPGDPLAPAAPAASAAETACLDAGRAAGFDVGGVVGTREVLGDGGLPQSRDVMLRIQRGSQSVEVRCRYTYLDGVAQIMTL